MIDVAIITCKDLPEIDVDEPLLLAALRARGLDVAMHPWDAGPLLSARIAVVRSTWNYYNAYDAFLAWMRDASSRAPIFNAEEIIRWNTDKSYLGELEKNGIRVVPTTYVDYGSTEDLGALMDARGFSDVVVKPRVSAGSFRTERHRRNEISGGELARAAKDRNVMVQPYVKAVDGRGERSYIAIAGEITHSVRKSPRFVGGVERVDSVPLDDVDVAFAKKVLAYARTRTSDLRTGELLYARVDLARDEEDRPMVMELELVEPSLFLSHAPAALNRFADAIEKRVVARR